MLTDEHQSSHSASSRFESTRTQLFFNRVRGFSLLWHDVVALGSGLRSYFVGQSPGIGKVWEIASVSLRCITDWSCLVCIADWRFLGITGWSFLIATLTLFLANSFRRALTLACFDSSWRAALICACAIRSTSNSRLQNTSSALIWQKKGKGSRAGRLHCPRLAGLFQLRLDLWRKAFHQDPTPHQLISVSAQETSSGDSTYQRRLGLCHLLALVLLVLLDLKNLAVHLRHLQVDLRMCQKAVSSNWI